MCRLNVIKLETGYVGFAMIFNVSTSGSTGSAMLANMFNKLGCVCFHGFGRGHFRFDVDMPNIPKTLSQEHGILYFEPTMHPEVLAGHLQALQKTLKTEQPIGITHTFFQTTNVRDAFKKRNGYHFCIVRNPNDRIKSQITAKIKDVLLKYNQSIDTLTGKELQDQAKEIMKAKSEDFRRFSSLVTLSTLFTDADNIQFSDVDEIIKFEGMFEPREDTPLVRLTSNISKTDRKEVVNCLLNSEKINEHLDFKLDLSFILSGSMKDDFKSILDHQYDSVENHFNVKLGSLYSNLGYDVSVETILKKLSIN